MIYNVYSIIIKIHNKYQLGLLYWVPTIFQAML